MRDKNALMISVVIPTLDDDPALIETLATLVAGIAEGVLRDAVIVGPPSPRIDDMAEAAGTARVVVEGTWAELIKAGASAARADYCFVIGAGLVPTGSWTLTLSDGIDQIQNPDEAGFLPLLPRPGLFESVKVALLTQKALLTGRPDHRHALLAMRSSLVAETKKFRLFRLEAAVSDRKIHRSSR